MKYSFLMPYKNRVGQLFNTLLSLQYWYSERDDWEVIIVVDDPSEKIIIPSGMEGRVTKINISRNGINPAPLFNIAARIAKGEFLVITNPECYHISNVLGWFDHTFKNCVACYAVAACYNVPHLGILSQYKQNLGTRNKVFQHSIEHNVLYHYCSSLHKTTYWKLGGFDDRFGDGYACEDDDFRDRVVCSGITCITDDSIIVLHQEHQKLKHTLEIKCLYAHNLALLEQGRIDRNYKHDVNVFKKR